MSCLNKINYIIQYGDSLYKISKMYNSTIENILNENPYLNPYNLQIGSSITVCVGTYDNSMDSSNRFSHEINDQTDIQNSQIDINQSTSNVISNTQSNNIQYNSIYETQYNNNPDSSEKTNSLLNTSINENQYYNNNTNNYTYDQLLNSQKETINTKSDLFIKMNALWYQHVHWIRMFLISIVENLPDLSTSNAYLLQNSTNIYEIYKLFYEEQPSSKINELLTNYIEVCRDIILAFKNGSDLEQNEMKVLQSNWHQIADTISEYLVNINNNYSSDELKSLLHNLLDLLSKEFILRSQNEYEQGAFVCNTLIEETTKIAQYLSNGIIKQFPNKFN